MFLVLPMMNPPLPGTVQNLTAGHPGGKLCAAVTVRRRFRVRDPAKPRAMGNDPSCTVFRVPGDRSAGPGTSHGGAPRFAE
jgi:hypothetical protein